MKSAKLLRRIQCGNLEAAIASVTLEDGQVRYGVLFHRCSGRVEPETGILFDFGELLTLSKLARLAHAAMDTLIHGDDDRSNAASS
ncbi:MAG: hypothetical protein JSR77_05765 [Planctomycetes bacterium]|nr:hypothetical protein [Planctomycetota bacterium]